jgi:hypothetical protein
MPLSSEEISTIQHAGVALHRASETIADALRLQAERMVKLVSLQPFQTESEQALTQFKALAGLSQELKVQEERLRSLYVSAEDLLRKPRSVPAPAARANPAHKPSRKRASKRPASVKPGPAALSPNDQKVLQYFQKVLKPGESVALSGSLISEGSGLPKGSVGVSVSRVVASGAVQRGPSGNFQLAAGPSA